MERGQDGESKDLEYMKVLMGSGEEVLEGRGHRNRVKSPKFDVNEEELVQLRTELKEALLRKDSPSRWRLLRLPRGFRRVPLQMKCGDRMGDFLVLRTVPEEMWSSWATEHRRTSWWREGLRRPLSQYFDDILLKLPDLINKAQFITIDTEFTGLRLKTTGCSNEYDTPETLYKKQKELVEAFMVIQYGIVIYNYNEINDKFTYQGYNFYVYPSTLCGEASFTCQASSLRFLAESGFDFNKLLREGIPFLREKEVQKLQNSLDEKYKRDLKVENQGGIIDTHCKQELLKPEIQSVLLQIDAALKQKKKEKIHIPKFNSFVRRLIYKSVHQKYRSKVFVVTNDDETMTALVGLTIDEYQEEVRQKFLTRKDCIAQNVGFSHVINLIAKSKKIIVGHNMFLDLMFTVNQFIQPLPPTLREFVDVLHKLFPQVIDTKHLATSSDLKNLTDTNLYCVHEYLKNLKAIPEVKATEDSVGFGVNDSTTHKASYDAYLTGECFLALCIIISKENYRRLFKSRPGSCPLGFAMNKLSIRKLLDTPTFLCLDGDVPNPDRSNVFHMTFPPTWRKDDIMKIFHSCGPVKIGWLSETTAYLSFEAKYLRQVHGLVGHHPSYDLKTFRALFGPH